MGAIIIETNWSVKQKINVLVISTEELLESIILAEEYIVEKMLKNSFDKLTDVLNSPLRRSMLLNLAMRPIGMIISFAYVPLLLHYLNDEQYGIWVTILSVLNWINFFDVGIGNGFRNVLAEDIARKDFESAKKTTATAYFSLTIIVSALFIIATLVGLFINWNVLFNTQLNIQPVIVITFTFICINFILGLRNVESYAIHKSEYTAISGIVVQLINLVGIVFLSYFNIDIDVLINMSILFSLSSFIVNIWFSLLIWRERKYLIPSLESYDKERLKKICNIGIQFFFLQIAGIVMFTCDNLMISYFFTPAEVTPYNTVYKFDNAIYSIFQAILSPLWSRFTVAKVEGDYEWIKNTVKKMLYIWLIFVTLMFGTVPYFEDISNLWIGRDLEYNTLLIVSMSFYISACMMGGICASVMNGMGILRPQLIFTPIGVITNIPLSIFLAVYCGLGTAGICLATGVEVLMMNIFYLIILPKYVRRSLGRGIK